MDRAASNVIAKEQLQIRRMIKHGTAMSERECEEALEKLASAVERLQELAAHMDRDFSCDLDVEQFLRIARSFSNTANEVAQLYAKDGT